MADPERIDPFEELRIGFTAAVSHELRTPLARLLALLDSATLSGSDTQALIAQAREEVEAMAELVDDVLFLSELETGRAVVALGDVRVAPIVDELVAAQRPSAERHGQELVTLVADDVNVAVRPRMLRVLVENLLANAIRYAGDGARVTVSARTEGDVVLLSVADNGRGVPAGELPRLFERFFRGDRARTTHGSGLGLAIVKHVVNQAAGDVEARSGPGGLGLEVRCTFPR
jgi:two-component system, OmpR family, phosphate regulon sensor histidine kinase PhoR